MDETMKIYEPGTLVYDPYSRTHFATHANVVDELKKFDEELKSRVEKEVKTPSHVKESKWKFFFDWKVWKEVIHENAERERALDKKHPWVEIVHRWVTLLCCVLLAVALGIWAINTYAEHTAEEYGKTVADQKDQEHQAYIDQQEADRKAAEESLENLMKNNATAKAKCGYGSRNFKEKYNYSDADYLTLYQCIDNRLKNGMYAGMTIEEIVFQEGQFIASYDTNPPDKYYFDLAMKSERLKHEREVNGLPEPVGSDYVYTIYTPHGIFLANDPDAPAYTWWHYSE